MQLYCHRNSYHKDKSVSRLSYTYDENFYTCNDSLWMETGPSVNTLRPRQNGRHFEDDIFKCIFLNENASIAIKISLTFVPNGPFNNNQALVQIMAWRRPGDKPLSEPMMVSLPTHICVTRPQWVKTVPDVVHAHISFDSVLYSYLYTLAPEVPRYFVRYRQPFSNDVIWSKSVIHQ